MSDGKQPAACLRGISQSTALERTYSMIKKSAILLSLMALVLTACGTARAGTPNNGKLNPMSELIVGTLKLDGTGQAVTKDQAKELITLWEVYKQLMTSDTAAQPEIDGLSQQIREAMTSDQLKAIQDMKLSQTDVMSYMQPQGGSAQGSGSGTGRSNNSSGMPGGGMPGGGMPGGGMPPSGAMPPGDFGGNMQRQGTGTQTPNSTAGVRPNSDRVPSMLIDALIQYLQKIAAA